ncbi:prepilin peptidase [Sedimentibacter sp. MB35-C1]|uniref:prepilin peptidase n=1 Tax=Sedimentibacter sp. MB35-C1 TaxID=3070995 RepID=UPI0027E1661E|nr:prepilin peptidase [Sedimentibacter sp. MB35-C1]WMJ77860.1 prepilin peptidase [Sedimentibacter sp. MB35-C1]
MRNIIYIVAVMLLIKISIIDVKQKIIPDRLNLIVGLLGIFNLILNFKNCKIYIASAAITFAVFLFLAIITNGGIGGGDIKLFTGLGLIFGLKIIEVVAVTFTLAAIISIMAGLKRKNKNIALGPYICAGVLFVIVKNLYIS